MNPTDLRSLVSKENVSSLAAWMINSRDVNGASVRSQLSGICMALAQHPDYRDMDLSWFRELLASLPEEPKSMRQERKAAKYVAYDVLAEIPDRIQKARRSSLRESKRAIATMVCDELLIQWLLVLPWRQRNLRECRLGASGNLIKAELPPFGMAIPLAIEDAAKLNPRERFWQFRFTEEETKIGRAVRGVVPRRLWHLLSEYLEQHRPRLLSGADPGTLFLNSEGGAMTDVDMTSRISGLTIRYAGHRVTPHLFRDIFAYKWLADHPEDYLTVSKILWHTDVNTTLSIYGSQFDESHGAARVDAWFGV